MAGTVDSCWFSSPLLFPLLFIIATLEPAMWLQWILPTTEDTLLWSIAVDPREGCPAHDSPGKALPLVFFFNWT